MDLNKRNTKIYDFKHPDLTKLKELAHHITDFGGFRYRYGNLLGILATEINDILLNTLLQFYDPLYHCFTFRDYQLVPTLEEYAYHVGLPVNEKMSFHGFEGDLEPYDVAKAFSLDTLDVKKNWANKGRKGLWSKFLFQEAFRLVEEKKPRAVEALFVVLVYGLMLFPDTPEFIDQKAIRIFLIGNPVPTLLADALYGIHHKVLRGKGTVVCCAQLLRNWFVAHLPRSVVFGQNLEGLSWSRRIISITSEDVKWRNDFYTGKYVINSCGDFNNVPLIGTRGGITYNPSLARRQFGFPMAKAPENVLLEGHYYTNGEESRDLRGRFIHAWEKVHKKDMRFLGKNNCVYGKPHKDWIADRVAVFKMPFLLEEPMRDIELPSSTELIFKTNDELRMLLTRMTEDRDAWKAKFLESENERKHLKSMYISINAEREAWEIHERAREEEIAALKKRLRDK